MKKFIYILLITLFQFSFAQNNIICYNFDVYIKFNYVDYSRNLKAEVTVLNSSEDPTYYLEKRDFGLNSLTSLYEGKYECLYKIDSLYRLDTINNPKKNIKSSIYTVMQNNKTNNRNNVEEIKYELDSVKNEYIVHIIKFKNHKKKKKVSEKYFFFKPNTNIKAEHIPYVNEIIKKYRLTFLINSQLLKIINLKKGEIETESTFSIVKNNIQDLSICLDVIDFYPKLNNSTTKAEIRYEEIRKSRQ